ncbi:YciI family protein [Flammeovirga sp. MY04]|uniref:YciI family protein n=1 Tax=Flammeovirga sp. MY04 TaxID=1191459 RepID=UPI0008061780|nr:YciI family protein [Flammeovirga sp. MY04]
MSLFYLFRMNDKLPELLTNTLLFIMKHIIYFFGLLIFIGCNTNLSDKDGYDENLAQSYEADQYGMKKYVMAFLKKGPNRSLSEEEALELQTKHLKNINRLADEGKLVLAGPFFGDGEIRGIYIFNVTSIEEAEALTNTDPAIQAKSLVMELKEWYGSAALMAVNDLHKKLEKTNVVDGGN